MPANRTAPRERPILFSGPMVRAIIEGVKTVTRRPIKPAPQMVTKHGIARWEGAPEDLQRLLEQNGRKCPYGQPGDRLWVRESWWQAGDWQATYPEDDTGSWFGSKRIVYSADGAPPNEPNRHYPNGLRNGAYSAAEPNKIWRHRPSIHMPRWASRILLEITAVRVERLQDISEEQARAEGCPADREPETGGSGLDAWLWFRSLWGEINGPEAFSANPWVWVVEFKRVTP